jgi:hypothetical protein
VQSLGQLISVRRFVPQQIAQIWRPSAGHPRRAFRTPQRGHVTTGYSTFCPEIRRISSEHHLHLLSVEPDMESHSAPDGIVEYFKELVTTALSHQRVATQELTAFYLVQLLAGFLRQAEYGDDEALALQLAQVMELGGARQRAGLKQIGDVSLFVSGYFSDSLRRKLVDVDYYATIGGSAYHALGRSDRDLLSPVFAELGDRFPTFIDVLTEVSERTSCTSNRDVLRLYEKWLRTGSLRSGQLLVEQGVVPNASLKDLRVQ